MTPTLPPALDPARARAALFAVDAKIDASSERWSLGNDRPLATPLTTLFDSLTRHDTPALKLAFARGLRRCALAQLRAFPENIFWDLDYLAASLLAQARRLDARGPALMDELTGLVSSLQDLFGSGSPIRFRYVHDFLYGYDWAKWVQRDPETRLRVGPFDLEFLRYMWRRGHELLELIARDDEKYPKLRDGLPRNPFAFSREPTDEAQLLRALAAHGRLPLASWRTDPDLQPMRPYLAWREDEARRLR